MAKRTFCDRCGTQCVNTIVNLHIVTVHYMKDGVYVGEDEHKPIELCLNCTDEIKAIVPQAFQVRERGGDHPDGHPVAEERMMAATPYRRQDDDPVPERPIQL